MTTTHASTVTVAAVKKTRHGAYGRRLAVVTIPVTATMTEDDVHAAAHRLLQAQMPGLRITTDIVEWHR